MANLAPMPAPTLPATSTPVISGPNALKTRPTAALGSAIPQELHRSVLRVHRQYNAKAGAILSRSRSSFGVQEILAVTGRHREVFGRDLVVLEPALCLRFISVLTIAFRGLTCHCWPCMLLNVRWTVFSKPLSSPSYCN